VGVLAREVETLKDGLRGWAAALRRLWAARPTLTRTAAIAFTAGAALAGASALLAQARLPSRLPSAQDWAALRALLDREGRPGDAAALSPAWAERAREVVPAAVPVFAQRRYAGEDLLGVRRLWLVSLPRAPGFSWEIEEDLLQRTGAGSARRVGALEVSRLDVSFPAVPLAFLPDHLAAAGGARARREVREVAGAPRPCLALEAADGPVTLSFVPLRIGRTLRGHVGAIAEDRLPGPVGVAVRVGAEDAGVVELSGAGFVPFRVDTTRFSGQVRPVSLVVTLPPGATRACLDGATLP
jgi:hypothetical protein